MPSETKRTLPIGAPSGAPSCSLSPGELEGRRIGLAELAATAKDRVADDGGITLRFALTDELLEGAWAALRAEASCCRDFRYVLTLAPKDGTLDLSVRTDVPGHSRWLRTVYLEGPQRGTSRG